MRNRNALLLASLGVFGIACNEYQINEKTDVQADLDEDGVPDIAVDPTSIDFGDVIAYDEVAAPPAEEVAVVTVTNQGDIDLHIEDVYLEEESGPFSIGALSSVLIQPGGSAQLTVTFNPREAGDLTNTIFFVSDDPDEGTVEVLLNGTGIAPAIELSPTEYDFGTLYVGCEGEQVFTISNVGTAPLEVGSVAWTTAGGVDLNIDRNEAANGPLPWTLTPGAEVQVVVSSAPTDEVPDLAYIDVASNDPLRPSVRASIDAAGELFGSTTDLFEQPIRGMTDIVFAVDRSCSMDDDIINVQNNFGTFVNTLASMDADYHVIATVEDNGRINGPDLYIDNSFSASQAQATITTMINLGMSYGSNTERPFMLFESFLAETRSGGFNEGAIREDAKLALVGVSDEPEQSVNNYTYYVSAFQSLKANPDDVIFHGIGGDWPSGCGSASAFTGFYEATVATGGLFLSICATDWGSHLEALAEGSAADLTSFPLTEFPVPSTIEVRVDGITTSLGWEYNASLNAIDFEDDYVPEGGSTIEVSYALYGDCEG